MTPPANQASAVDAPFGFLFARVRQWRRSWYGKHARRTKEDVKKMLPPAACKQCVYWFRLVIGSSSSAWHHDYSTCPRCGIPKWELLDKFTAIEQAKRETATPPPRTTITAPSSPRRPWWRFWL